MKIPFNKPFICGNEIEYIQQAVANGKISGDGIFSEKCTKFLKEYFSDSFRIFLTPSCTAALELSALLIDLKAGDEVIMSSFTFTSTANAFVLQRGKPVFVDIREDTLNIDENEIEEAITENTKAVVPMHYAGIGCEMDKIVDIAKKHRLYIIEDAAHSIFARYKGRLLGTIGDFGTFSFHETKNIICGEGGALLINNKNFVEKAEIIREKGTNRSKFFRGEVEKYWWIAPGSSYLLSDLNAAFLYAQLENFQRILAKRKQLWFKYHQLLEPLEKSGRLRRPIIPFHCEHNAHIYYILLESENWRNKLIAYLNKNGILAVFHYVPLHLSPAGKKYGVCKKRLKNTETLSKCLIRLPLYFELKINEVSYIVEKIFEFFGRTGI